MQLATGQRSPLANLNLSSMLDVVFEVSGSAADYAPVCFLLGADSKAVGEAVSPGQPRSTDGAINYSASRFEVQLERLATGIERLAFCLVPDSGGLKGVQRGAVSLNTSGGAAAATWNFSGADFGSETAIIALEIYRHQGAWRVMVNGQGFADGLAGLVKNFGGSGLLKLKSAAPPAPTPAPQGQQNQGSSSGRIDVTKPGASSSASNNTSGRSISLTKITLDKQGQSARISLQKAGTQRVHVNLNWDAKPVSAAPSGGGGFLGKLLGSVTGAGKAADLDLGCMYELADGEKGVIQALGGNFGASGRSPFIVLDQDDRTGASTGGENLYIERPDLIRKVLIFAFIYEGAGNFSDVGGRLSFNDPQGNEVKMQLSSPAAQSFCAVALVQAQGGELVITKEERYFPGHRDADAAFGFGFNWKAGRK